MTTKITVVAAILLASVSGAFASEAFDVDINRPAVSQSYEAYAQAPKAQRTQAQHRQANDLNVDISQDNAYTDRASQID